MRRSITTHQIALNGQVITLTTYLEPSIEENPTGLRRSRQRKAAEATMWTTNRRSDRRAALTLGLAVVVGAAESGCATTSLPVQHVVVFRNGIAYFERGGHVSQDQVRFTVRQAGVSDLLATLAARETTNDSRESGRSPVRAVHLDPTGGNDSAETVVLSLDGRAHDLTVGYIASCPIWKPSYRLALRGDGQATLQIWGIVENSSGEDWKNVRLSLVSGAPIAYASDLGSSVTPLRPQFSDRGQETPVMPPGAYGYRYGAVDASVRTAQLFSQSTSSAPASAVDQEAAARRRQVGLMERSADTATPGNAPLATMTTQGGSTRYDVAAELSIPNDSASMVMVADRPVLGELAFVYSPADAPPFASNHPFRAVRFENRTEGTLEAGPMSMFAGDAFLGQAVTETLAPGASAILPFGLEGGIEVTHEVHSDEVNGPLAGGVSGELTLNVERATRTVYRVRNDTGQPAKVVVRHPRAPNTRLHSPPQGTQENAGASSALIPVTVGAHAGAELAVDERATTSTPVDWMAPAADTAVKQYLADGKSDPAVVDKLKAAWAIRGEIAKLNDQRSSLRMKAYDLGDANTAAKAAYERQLKELDSKIADLTTKFEKALGEIRLK
jgi:hypothetical protein